MAEHSEYCPRCSFPVTVNEFVIFQQCKHCKLKIATGDLILNPNSEQLKKSQEAINSSTKRLESISRTFSRLSLILNICFWPIALLSYAALRALDKPGMKIDSCTLGIFAVAAGLIIFGGLLGAITFAFLSLFIFLFHCWRWRVGKALKPNNELLFWPFYSLGITVIGSVAVVVVIKLP